MNWWLSAFGKSQNRWRCSYAFSVIFGIRWSWFLVDEIAQKIIFKIYNIRNNNDAILILSLSRGRCLFVFPNILEVVLSRILLHGCICRKFYMQYTYFATWYWYNFCDPSLLKGGCCHNFFKIFWKNQILCSIERNCTKIYMQDIYY